MKIATEPQRERWITFVRQQSLPVDLSCEPWREPRSLASNKYLWKAVYEPLVERCGFSPELWHEHWCIEHFGGIEEVKPSGVIEIRPRRTTTRDENGKRDVLKGKAFADFVTFVESECAKRGVFVAEAWEGD
jgi:hypothetical protein